MKKRIVILGSGESGTGAALLAQRQGLDVFVSDKGAIKEEYKKQLDARGITWEEGEHSMDKILKANEIIKSPGIPEKSEVMQAVRAKGIEVIGEIEFGWRYAGKCKIVAITGSNGKTTTTELAWHLLKTAGLNARKGGNVGNSFATMVLEDLNRREAKTQRVFVLEISSFQLDDIQKFRPDIAILLNITPDHLDRYDYKLENYACSKFRITMNQKRGDVFIFNAFDPVIASCGTTQSRATTGVVTSKNLPIPRAIHFLYDHLLEHRNIVDIQNFNPDILGIYHKEVLKQIQNGESGWEEKVPEEVARLVKEKGLFGFER